MKKYSLAILASCIAMPVMAADVPANEPVVAEAPPAVYDWTGFSVGVHAGVAGGDVTYPFSLFDEYEGEEILSGELGLNNGGVFGGGGVGADYQFSGGFVVGVLADISATDIDGKLSIDLGDGNNSLSAEAGSSVEWFATARGRIGYAWDRLLIYGTGGAAFGEVESSFSIDFRRRGYFRLGQDGSRRLDGRRRPRIRHHGYDHVQDRISLRRPRQRGSFQRRVW